MKIVFVGDVFCGGDLLKEKSSPDLIQIPEFHKADFRIANLEGPLSDCRFVADKPTIYAPTSAVEYLKTFKIDGVSLANNHIQDKGEAGILETIHTLEKASIKYVGAGETPGKARQPLVLTDGEEKVAILAYCDFDRPYMRLIHLATEKSPGVAPLRYEAIIEDVENLPSDINKVILFFHWGREHTWFPPPNDVELARKLLDHPRVDLIVGCHSHLPQGCIEHNGKKAFPGLGNFLFPNFFTKPPVQIDYPESASDYDTMLGYHSVRKLTQKRWAKWCRRALMLSYDTANGTCSVHFTEQDYLNPVVRELPGFRRFFILNRIYNKGGRFYHYLSDSWYGYILLKRLFVSYKLHVKHYGLANSARKFIAKVSRRLSIISVLKR